jgi:hypothetical protein
MFKKAALFIRNKLIRTFLREKENKMSHAWLQPANLVKVAQQLLSMTKEDFKPGYQEEAMSRLANLEEILYHYIFPTTKITYNKYSAVEETEQQLCLLMRHVQYMLSLLTPGKIKKLRSDVELDLDKDFQQRHSSHDTISST